MTETPTAADHGPAWSTSATAATGTPSTTHTAATHAASTALTPSPVHAPTAPSSDRDTGPIAAPGGRPIAPHGADGAATSSDSLSATTTSGRGGACPADTRTRHVAVGPDVADAPMGAEDAAASGDTVNLADAVADGDGGRTAAVGGLYRHGDRRKVSPPRRPAPADPHTPVSASLVPVQLTSPAMSQTATIKDTAHVTTATSSANANASPHGRTASLARRGGKDDSDGTAATTEVAATATPPPCGTPGTPSPPPVAVPAGGGGRDGDGMRVGPPQQEAAVISEEGAEAAASLPQEENGEGARVASKIVAPDMACGSPRADASRKG